MAGYDPNLDQVVGAIQECALTGNQQQNALYVFIRSYNGGSGKVEINRHQPNQKYPDYQKSIRLEVSELEFILKHADNIRQMLANTGAQIQQAVVVPINQRPHPIMQQNSQQHSQQNLQAPPAPAHVPYNNDTTPPLLPNNAGFAPQGTVGFTPPGTGSVGGGFAPQGFNSGPPFGN